MVKDYVVSGMPLTKSVRLWISLLIEGKIEGSFVGQYVISVVSQLLSNLDSLKTPLCSSGMLLGVKFFFENQFVREECQKVDKYIKLIYN